MYDNASAERQKLAQLGSRVARSAMRDKGWVSGVSDELHTAGRPGVPGKPAVGLLGWRSERSQRRIDIRSGPSLSASVIFMLV
jgi:hypothetical protein